MLVASKLRGSPSLATVTSCQWAAIIGPTDICMECSSSVCSCDERDNKSSCPQVPTRKAAGRLRLSRPSVPMVPPGRPGCRIRASSSLSSPAGFPSGPRTIGAGCPSLIRFCQVPSPQASGSSYSWPRSYGGALSTMRCNVPESHRHIAEYNIGLLSVSQG